MPDIGHNSVNPEAAKELKGYISRIESLEEEKANLLEDIKVVFSEAKAKGFDTKIMKEVLKRRKMAQEDREYHDEILAVYEGTIFG